MAKYTVPVVVTVTGYITVEAINKGEAIDQAVKKYYSPSGRLECLEMADHEVDIASGEDEDEVEILVDGE